MAPSRLVLVAALLGGALSACGAGRGPTSGAGSEPTTVIASTSRTDPVGSSTVAQPDRLDGRTFRSTSVVVDGVERPLVADTSITVTFRGATISARAGCNAMEGGYRLVDGVLIVDQLGSTLMGCDGALLAQDRWIADVLAARPTLFLGGGTLTIAGATSRITLVDAAAVPPTVGRTLAGPTWLVDTLIDGPSASSVPAGVEAKLHIEGDQLTFDTGCNTGGATVRIDGDIVRVNNVVLTAKGCEGAAASVERLVVSVLDASPTFHIEGEQLRLDAGEDRGLGLHAAA